MKKLFIALMACTLVFASCQKNEDPQKKEEEKKEEQKEDEKEDVPPNNATSVGIEKSFSEAASLDFNNENAVVDFFKGEHSVAIYNTPSGKDNEIGKGKLVVSRSGNIFGMKLLGAGGSTLAEANVDLTNGSDYNYEGLRKVGSLYNIDASEYLNGIRTQIGFYISENGELTGGVVWKDGALQYRFRNNVEYFGKKAPAAIAALKGNWEGAHIQPLCLPNPVTMSIASDGKIILKGKTALNCTSAEVNNVWDGQGDYVVANTTGWKPENKGSMIYLDAHSGGGSLPGGGVWILVPKLENPTSILEVQSYGAGAAGNILVEKPAKK